MLTQLYQQSTGSMNPSSLTGTLPGGAGSVTTGTVTAPGISAPTVEAWHQEVLDATAPSLITSGKTLGTPAAAGKLLVADLTNGSFGAIWKLAGLPKLTPYGMGTFGIVSRAGDPNSAGVCVGTSNGNLATGTNARADVILEGPAQAYINTTVTNTAVSAGMTLGSDGAGNLTYTGASPAAGATLAIAAQTVGAGISIPVLASVYVGGY